MRTFHDGDVIVVEPFRATAFPIVKDLVTDRSGFDKILQAGGLYHGAHRRGTGGQRDADSERRRGSGDGRRGLHRLRSVRCGL